MKSELFNWGMVEECGFNLRFGKHKSPMAGAKNPDQRSKLKAGGNLLRNYNWGSNHGGRIYGPAQEFSAALDERCGGRRRMLLRLKS